VQRVVLMQAAARGFLARRGVKERLRVGRWLVHVLRSTALRWMYMKVRRAALHYRHTLKGRIHRWLRRYTAQSQRHSIDLTATLVSSKRKRDVRIYWSILLDMRQEFRDLKYEDCAAAFYEVRFLKRILSHWREVIHETANRNQLLVRQFMAAIALDTHNSRRQTSHRLIASHFNNRRILMTSWLCFARGYLAVKRINALVPMALQHARETFFTRMVQHTAYSTQHTAHSTQHRIQYRIQ
jgi:hypothetical protein